MRDVEPTAFVERPSIVLTTRDCNRLSALLKASPDNGSDAARFLREELDRADIVRGGVATMSLVTMGSEVTFIDDQSISARRIRLVYPDEIKDRRSISVLTPIGSALLGLGPGQSISWSEEGRERQLTVLEVRSFSEGEK